MRLSPLFGFLFLISDNGQAEILSQSVARFPVYTTPPYGQHDGIGSSLLSFMQLVRQRSNGNQLQQCPCIHLPGSDKCITYDSRYMAVSIEEAILTFVDQTMDPRIYEQRTGGPITPASFTCASTECRQCVAMIAARLRQIGLLRRQLTFSFPVPSIDQINPSACPRIRLSRGINIPLPTRTVSWGEFLSAEAIQAATALRDQFSQRPKSVFARIVEQAINEAEGGGGRPQISKILQSPSSHSVSLPPTAERQNGQASVGSVANNNQNNGATISRPNNNGQVNTGTQSRGSTNIGTGQGRGTQIGNDQSTSGQNAGSIDVGGNAGGNTRINVGAGGRGNQNNQFGGIQAGGRFGPGRGPNFQAGLGADGRVIGVSRPRNLPRPRPQLPRFPQPLRQQFTPNPGQIGRFQQAIGNQFGNRGQQFISQPPQIVTQPPQFVTQQPQFVTQPPQFVTQQPQFVTQQPQFQQVQPQFSQNWNGQGWNGGQPQFWQGQQGGFGVQPQTVTNALGQASQFIPDPGSIAASSGGSSFGGNNGGNNAGFGVGLGTGGNNFGGFGGGTGGGGAGGAAGSGEHSFGGFGGFGRKKRQAKENVAGERFVISCIEKGDAETENTDFLNLCTVCWTWRQLPENYFPRLLNELVCQEDDYCLSGWGTCSQRYRNVDILQKNGNDWIPTTISTATCCDCKVKAGSDAHSLVIGGKK